MEDKELAKIIRQDGEELPKKHGSWYKLHVRDNNYLILDTWNSHVYHYPNGATPSDTNNMYRCVYVFHDLDGKVDNRTRVKGSMKNNFWHNNIIRERCLNL